MMESPTHTSLFSVFIHMESPWCVKMCVILQVIYLCEHKNVFAIQTLSQGRSNSISVKFDSGLLSMYCSPGKAPIV